MARKHTSASIAPSQVSSPQRQFFCDEVGRREFVCGGGASVLSAILAALLGGSKPVRAAEAVTGSVPELDRVAVRIVIDSYQFAVAPSRKLPNLDIQHFGWGLSDKPPRRTLISEFGLAMQVESRRGVDSGVGCYPERLTEAERSAPVGPISARNRNGVQSERTRAHHTDLVQPSRRGQRDQASSSRLRCRKDSRSDRGLPSRALSGGLCSRNGQGTPGNRSDLY